MSAVEDALARSRVLPVVAVDDAAVIDDLCGALLEGGISCIEITFRTDAAARFAVAPGTDADVVGACADAGLPFFPGIATPSELGHAARLGCSAVKVFPAASLGGPAFLRAVSATFPHARFIPTGGIDAGSLAAYLAVPSVLACGGSWICESAFVRERRFGEITRRARAAVEAAA